MKKSNDFHYIKGKEVTKEEYEAFINNKTMSNNKQSSIDWLMDEFNKIIELHPSQFIKINNAIEQAKEMHKQEMIEFSKKCFNKALDLDIRTVYFKIEEYYNETFE